MMLIMSWCQPVKASIISRRVILFSLSLTFFISISSVKTFPLGDGQVINKYGLPPSDEEQQQQHQSKDQTENDILVLEEDEEITTTITSKATNAASMNGENSNRKSFHGPTTMGTHDVLHNTDRFARVLQDTTCDQVAKAIQNQIQRLPRIMEEWYHRLMVILQYQPPVGIVAFAVTMRLLFTGRILTVYAPEQYKTPASLMEREYRKREQERHRGRSLHLDRDDIQYNWFGGIDRIRRRLCWSALVGQEIVDDPLLVKSLIEALSVYNIPGGSRARMVQDLIPALAQMEIYQFMKNNNNNNNASRSFSSVLIGTNAVIPGTFMITSADWDSTVTTSVWAVQVQATDALLRVCRDRLLKTTYRLAKSKEYWQRRVQRRQSVMTHLVGTIIPLGWQSDQLRLSYTQAAYHADITRLGQIASVLMDRPSDMDESSLLHALSQSERLKHTKQQIRYTNPQYAKFQPSAGLGAAAPSAVLKVKQLARIIPLLRRYSIRWNVDGRRRITLTKRDDTDEEIERVCAIQAVASYPQQEEWVHQARLWVVQARTALCQVLEETLSSTEPNSILSLSSSTAAHDLKELRENWSLLQYQPHTDVQLQWRKVLHYVDKMPSWRRVGEDKLIRLRDVALVDWIRQLDAFGIPSALLWIWVAKYAHDKVKPHWPWIRHEVTEAARKITEIVYTRFYIPLKEIYNDIMNKSPGIFSAFGLDVEQTSLDHMLRDMGFGDGTPSKREEALQRATQQYEDDLRSGVFINFARGRLVRLLLVQVQQLKVGLLSALDTIDTLLQGNRIHFQILAIIPAGLMLVYGTRLFLRSLYNIRAADLRPVTMIHQEMTQYINNMINIFLLSHTTPKAGEPLVVSGANTSSLMTLGRTPSRSINVPTQPHHSSSSSSTTLLLQPSEMGELLLNIHRYLTLMDYMNPPFPVWHCNDIHISLQELMGVQGTIHQRLGIERQVLWMDIIQKKHQDLLKHT